MARDECAEQTELLVVGGGPGGYVAAFRAADLGVQTTIVDESPLLGGVCLREGCIPSKALLHVAHLLEDAAEAEEFGVAFQPPRIDIDRLRSWKNSVVAQLCAGITKLAGQRKVRVIRGRATFEDSGTVRVAGADGGLIHCQRAIVATGSRAKRLPPAVIPTDCCIDSTGALALPNVPRALLIIGGGYIGLELGQVYAALGSKVTVVEMLDRILPGCDTDLARPLAAKLRKQFEAIHTSATLTSVRRGDSGVEVVFNKRGQEHQLEVERVLVSVGRQPNSDNLGLENTKVRIDERGFIEVDQARRTADEAIYAIGDVAGEPMLAHKASREGIVAAEVIAGRTTTFSARAIPAVVYTSPEVAWCGLTESEAKEQGRNIRIGKSQWGVSGRAVAMGRPYGVTKIIADAETHKLLGVGIAGEHAGDLIAEAVLAIELGAGVEDLAATIHSHPTTSETIMEAAESVFGTAIHAARR
ncbi:MAG: dihydrolipoyl dehydrogenase [Planctomycetes bacterium]|nr:dihydrolipoyl dehydrogenase [Planctomycetota bacterium]